MNVGVILNRVFRTQNNPLLEYISQQQNDIDQCYLIIPQEIFEENGTKMKRNFYYGVLEKFLTELKKRDIEPFLIEYSELGDFCKEKHIEEVVIAGDIMSYHQESYDIHHLKKVFKKYDISVVTLRANHYFKPSTTMNKQSSLIKCYELL